MSMLAPLRRGYAALFLPVPGHGMNTLDVRILSTMSFGTYWRQLTPFAGPRRMFPNAHPQIRRLPLPRRAVTIMTLAACRVEVGGSTCGELPAATSRCLVS